MQKAFFFPDSHHPYADTLAYQCALNACREYQPNILTLLGDFGDAYGVNGHGGRKPDAMLLHEELVRVNEELDRLDEVAYHAGTTRKIYIMGNHENRYDRFIAAKAPELYRLTTWEKLTHLEARGWEVIQYREGVWFGKLYATHDVGHSGKSAVTQSMSAMGGHSIIFGHTHRLQQIYESTVTGEQHVGINAGWLGDRDSFAVDYTHPVKKRQWMHGFAYGTVFDDDTFSVTTTPIINGRTFLNGVLVNGSVV